MEAKGKYLESSFLNFHAQVQNQPDRRRQNIPVSSDLRVFANKQQPSFKGSLDLPENKKDDKSEIVLGAASAIPYFRRLNGIQDAVLNHDNFATLAKTALFVVNAPEDTRDISNALKQYANKAVEVEKALPHSYQTRFSFFRGTLFEPLLKKLINSESKNARKLGKKIVRMDSTLYDTKLGEKINKILNVTEKDVMKTARKEINGAAVKAIELEGKAIPKLIGRAMLRVPMLGVYALMTIGAVSALKHLFDKNNSKENIAESSKQVVKTGINDTATVASSAVFGALLAGRFGATGSLVGIGVGSYLGSKAVKLFDSSINS